MALLNGGDGLDLVSGAQATVSGNVTGNVRNDGALSLPGVGVFAVTGNYTQTAAGSLIVNIGGATAGTFDQLQVSGAATLNGALTAQVINGFVPPLGTSVPVMTFASSTGDFATRHFVGAGNALTSSFTPTSLLVTTVTPNADLVVTGQPVANANAGGTITYTITLSLIHI